MLCAWAKDQGKEKEIQEAIRFVAASVNRDKLRGDEYEESFIFERSGCKISGKTIMISQELFDELGEDDEDARLVPSYNYFQWNSPPPNAELYTMNRPVINQIKNKLEDAVNNQSRKENDTESRLSPTASHSQRHADNLLFFSSLTATAVTRKGTILPAKKAPSSP